jgi:hypothetical protein
MHHYEAISVRMDVGPVMHIEVLNRRTGQSFSIQGHPSAFGYEPAETMTEDAAWAIAKDLENMLKSRMP